MKKITLSLLLAASAGSVTSAQPTIHTNDMPLTGEFIYKNTYFSQGTYSPGGAGANITWDFSQMSDSFESHMVTGVCPGEAVCEEFPEANHYLHLTEAGDNASNSYTMYEVTDEDFNMVGSSNGIDEFYHASDPQMIYQFPITYNQAFNDHYSISNSSTTQKGSATNTVDGYGTVITPTGTYHNVLRCKTERIDTLVTGSGTSITTTTGYSWLKAGIGSVATFTINDLVSPAPQQLSSTFTYTTQSDASSGVSETGALNDQINIYPNPAGNDNINIACDGLTMRSIVLTDMTGKILFKKVIAKTGTHNPYQIPVSGIAAGIYLIHLDTDKGTVARDISVMK